MAGAFAHRINFGVGDGLHGVVDYNTSIAVQAAAGGQFVVRANAHRHYNQVCVVHFTIGKFNFGHTPISPGMQGFGVFGQQKFQAFGFKTFLQQTCCGGVKLAFHQPGGQMHHADIHALNGQAVGGFQAQQTATDYDCFFVMLGGLQHGFSVGNVAVTDDARQS